MFALSMQLSKSVLLLPSSEKILYWNVCRTLIRIRGDLAHKSFPSVLDRVKRSVAYAACHPHYARFDVRTVCRAVERAARYLPGQYLCLAQALAGYVVCSRYGLESVLKVGVKRGRDNRFEAHAWLEHNGKIVVGYLPDLDRFRVFDQFAELVK